MGIVERPTFYCYLISTFPKTENKSKVIQSATATLLVV